MVCLELCGRVSDNHFLLMSSYYSVVTAESAAVDTLKNAMHSFRSSGIVERYEVADLPILALGSSYNDDDVLQEFIRHLEMYRE